MGNHETEGGGARQESTSFAKIVERKLIQVYRRRVDAESEGCRTTRHIATNQILQEILKTEMLRAVWNNAQRSDAPLTIQTLGSHHEQGRVAHVFARL